MGNAHELSRRALLQWTGTTLLASAGGLVPRWSGAEGGRTAVFETPYARIVPLGEAVWAVESTPLAARDFTTLCNGGIVAGERGVLVVESFAGADGGRWVAERAADLTGRWPTEVLVTHYHGDHTGGLAGFHGGDGETRLLATEETLAAVTAAGSGDDAARAAMLDGARRIDGRRPTAIDLGGRAVALHPRAGHTASDVTAELDDPAVVFAGDLVWNGLFPNYRDTTPSRFVAAIRALTRDGECVYVPGHGALADRAAVELLVLVVDDVFEHARRAHGEGVTAAAAADRYALPEAAADWHLFNPGYFQTAIQRVYDELG